MPVGSAAGLGGFCRPHGASRRGMALQASWCNPRGARLFATNMALTVAANVTLAALGMVSGILAARLLGPHGRGQLAAIQTWPSSIATLAMLGMPEAVVYYS